MEEDLRRKLTKLGINDRAKKQFLDDIFQDRFGEEGKSLANCQSSEEFDETLKSLRRKWDGREMAARDCDRPLFYAWFCKNAAEDIRDKMSSQVRRRSGLGTAFTTTMPMNQ